MMKFEHGMSVIRKLLKSVGLNPDEPYTRLIIECSVTGVPQVYATKHVTADDVLRVVETLDGARVEAKDDDTVEIVTLTEAGK
jgi:hypothetical protein